MARITWNGTSQLDVSGASLTSLAEDFAIRRGQEVSEAICHIATLRSAIQPSSGFGKGASIRCTAAQVQDSRATRGVHGPQQAAHLLPGTISVNGTNIWDLPTRAFAPDLSANQLQIQLVRIKQSFAKTQVLPADVNRADTEAEGKSDGGEDRLKPIFAECIKRLWSNSKYVTGSQLAVDRSAMLMALSYWFSMANDAYAQAANRKRIRAESATGERRNRRMNEFKVLETYANSFKVVNIASFMNRYCGSVYFRYPFI